MKRDMDLCREILQCIEGQRAGVYTIGVEDLGANFSDVDLEAVNHHVTIMIGAGFIDPTGSMGRRGAPLVKGLTWEGHEFVEKSRDQGLWEKAKRLTKEKTGGIAMGILSPLLTALAKNAVGLDG